MTRLEDMPNIGKLAADKLRRAGIHTPEELREIGSREAFLRIRLEVDGGACLSMLSGLEGAVQNVRRHSLPTATRAELKTFFDELNGKARA